MEKKEKSVLIWILAMAAMLLLILYSPIGSPDIYIEPNYVEENQGVTFFGRIMNAPKGKSFSIENNASGLIKDISTVAIEQRQFGTTIDKKNISTGVENLSNSKKAARYSVSTTQETTKQFDNNSYSVTSVNSSVKVAQSNMIGGGVSLPSFGTFNSSSKNNNNSEQKNNSLASLNIDLSLFDELIGNRQSADYAEDEGGSDPGFNPEEEPLGEPVPVGDGWWILVLMAAVYAKIKIK